MRLPPALKVLYRCEQGCGSTGVRIRYKVVIRQVHARNILVNHSLLHGMRVWICVRRIHDGQWTAFDRQLASGSPTVHEEHMPMLTHGLFGGYEFYQHLTSVRMLPLARILHYTSLLRNPNSRMVRGEAANKQRWKRMRALTFQAEKWGGGRTPPLSASQRKIALSFHLCQGRVFGDTAARHVVWAANAYDGHYFKYFAVDTESGSIRVSCQDGPALAAPDLPGG